jgi:hypothetical protein
MSEHTKEPWTTDKYGNLGAGNPEYILGRLSELPAENAARIVACVNACARVDTETLVKIATGEMIGSEILELAQLKADYSKLEAECAALKSRVDFLNAQNSAQQEQSDKQNAQNAALREALKQASVDLQIMGHGELVPPALRRIDNALKAAGGV